MADLPFQETETSIASENNKLGTVAERHAKRLLDRVQSGQPLGKAAAIERIKMSQLRDPSSPVRLALEQLVSGHFLPPEARKQMVRAGLNKIFMDNVTSADPAAQKVALDAAKQISLDPEVGLSQEQTGGVIVNIGELSGVFEQLKTIKSPEINHGRQREDRITEGEFEDIPAGGSESVPVPDVSE